MGREKIQAENRLCVTLHFGVKDSEGCRTWLKDFKRASDDTSCFSGEITSETGINSPGRSIKSMEQEKQLV